MDADTLRYILIVVGAILILALYLWERSREPRTPEHREEADAASPKREPRFGGLNEAYTDSADSAGAASDESGNPLFANVEPGGDGAALSRPEPLLIQFSVVATGPHFAGPDLLQAVVRCGLEPGDMDIFHASVGKGGGSYSMANMVKPGTFPFDAMEDFESPGLMLFAQLDGGAGGMQVLDEMLATARHLATSLGGEVLDETRKPLTVKKEEVLRARIIDHELWSNAS